MDSKIIASEFECPVFDEKCLAELLFNSLKKLPEKTVLVRQWSLILPNKTMIKTIYQMMRFYRLTHPLTLAIRSTPPPTASGPEVRYWRQRSTSLPFWPTSAMSRRAISCSSYAKTVTFTPLHWSASSSPAVFTDRFQITQPKVIWIDNLIFHNIIAPL